MDQSTKPVSNSYKTFGLISLILGILAFIFSFVPCLGMYAMFPGILGIIFGLIGFVQAGKINAPKGMVIAGIVLSILGTAVAVWQYKTIKNGIKQMDSSMKDLNKSLDSMSKSMDSLTKANDKALDSMTKATDKALDSLK